jgi:ubiquinone/menaquinone biosynthesis C-methylase UbiE
MDTVKELVRQHWRRRAADFDREASHGLLTDGQARAWRRLISGLAGAAPLDVLDVGCGTGFLSLLFAAERHHVTGVDLAPTMLVRAITPRGRGSPSVSSRLTLRRSTWPR